MKHSTGCVLVCLVFSLALFAGGEDLPLNQKDTCTYTVIIETTCTAGAATSNNISLRFGDTKSNDIVIRHLNGKHVRQLDPIQPVQLDDVPTKPFQACVVDEFQVTNNKCVESPICYLYLKSHGQDDWRPGFAMIRAVEEGHLSSQYFYFRRYLPRNVWHGLDLCKRITTRFGIKQKRKAFRKNP